MAAPRSKIYDALDRVHETSTVVGLFAIAAMCTSALVLVVAVVFTISVKKAVWYERLDADMALVRTADETLTCLTCHHVSHESHGLREHGDMEMP